MVMVVSCFAACGGGPENGGETTTTEGGGGDEKPPKELYDIPVIEMTVNDSPYVYKGYTKGRSACNPQFVVDDFFSDTPDKDALSYAVYDRNNKIQSTYKCTIINRESTLESTFDEMKGFFENNEKYEVAVLGAYDLSSCAANGFLRDMNRITTTGFDLTHEAYDANAIEQLDMGGTLYYVNGAMNDSTLDNAPANMFNTALFAEFQDEYIAEYGQGYADLYKMVELGTWTVDAMMNMASITWNDVSASDGDLDYSKGDTLGYFGYSADTVYYWFGCDMRIASNIGGYPSLDGTINTSEAELVYNKLFELFNKPLNNSWISRGDSGTRRENFNSGMVMFTSYVLSDVRYQVYLDNEVSYGILPIAKYSDGQDGYRSVVYYQKNYVHLWALPVKNVNADYSALMLQVMAVWSDLPDSTMDAYYYKVVRDDDSCRSLDIIKDSLVYDYGMLFDSEWANMDTHLRQIGSSEIVGGSFNAFASEDAIASATERMNGTLNKFK